MISVSSSIVSSNIKSPQLLQKIISPVCMLDSSFFSNNRRTMKLMTHNMLSSAFLKGVTTGFPLNLEVAQSAPELETIKLLDAEYSEDFIKRLVLKLDYAALRGALQQLPVPDDVKTSLPEQLPANWEREPDLLRKIHRAACEVEVLEGNLVCPESGRKFPIKKGIPNMMAAVDELK